MLLQHDETRMYHLHDVLNRE